MILVGTKNDTDQHNPNDVKKGEIWFISQKDTTSTGCEMWSNRPAIIVSNNVSSAKAGFLLVVYLTTKKKKRLPSHISIDSDGRDAIALCEQIHTIDRSRLSFYISTISEKEMKDVDKAILFSLGISNSLRPSTIFQKWANAVERYRIPLDENPNTDDITVPTETNANTSRDYINLLQTYKHLYEYEKSTRIKAETALAEIEPFISDYKKNLIIEANTMC